MSRTMKKVTFRMTPEDGGSMAVYVVASSHESAVNKARKLVNQNWPNQGVKLVHDDNDPNGDVFTDLRYHLSARELATVLAALRKFQTLDISDTMLMSHFQELRLEPLDEHEIDKLCERLNLGVCE